jgi:hypothetical protein
MSKKYDINSYSDEECFTMLNLNNPSDRVLEMKILEFMDMYQTKSKRLYKFFESMYDRFFAEEEEEEAVEGFTDLMIMKDGSNNTMYWDPNSPEYGKLYNPDEKNTEEYKAQQRLSEAQERLSKAQERLSEAKEQQSSNNRSTIVNKGNTTTKFNEVRAKKEDDVLQVTQVDYVKDKFKLNPVERKTIFKMISIDSQFREDPTNTSATSFTMNLSEGIDNVISMKLYSVQIPYTWYTINSTFGSNFFFIKGNSPGINNGDHDIKIEIGSGTYTPQQFVTAIQAKINEFTQIGTNANKYDAIYNTVIDVSFGNTTVSYNKGADNAKFVFEFDLKKKYNETDYQLYFPSWSTPNVVGEAKSLTIPSFLGYNYDNYYPYIAYSSRKVLNQIGDPSELNNITLFTLDGSNNYFTIYQYTGTSSFNLATSTVINMIKINITLELGNRSRAEIAANLNENMKLNPLLDANYSRFERVNGIDLSHSHFEIAVKLNRKEILQTDNSKLAIVFPNETNAGFHIWTGQTSCFVFPDFDTIELNEVVSETEILLTNFIISSDAAKIIVECTKPNYNVIENTRTVTVAGSSASGFLDGYLFSTYITAVNNALEAMNNSTKIEILLVNGEFNISAASKNTRLFISDDLATFHFDITRFFTQETYIVDLSSCFLSQNPFNFPANISNLTNTNFSLTRAFSSASTIQINAGNNKIALIPKTTGGPFGNGYGNQNSGIIEVFFTNGTYNTLFELINRINNDFIDFVDSDGYQIMRGSSISFANSTITLNLKINKVLTETDYRVKFQDGNNNSWANYLKMDSSYNLADYEKTTYSDIYGSSPVFNNVIQLTPLNNKFVFKPYTNGVADAGGANDIVFSIPLSDDNTKSYTREGLIDAIQLLFNANPLSTGSTIRLITDSNLEYTNIRMNINKTFFAEDFKLVFYDPQSFVYCNVGVAQNVTYDSTLGWLLGFQSFTEYELRDFTQITDLQTENYKNNVFTDNIEYTNSYNVAKKKIAVIGDTVLNTNLYNYFLVVVDDFIQNHVNAGLITITSLEKDVALPSYASRLSFQCDPITGQKVAVSATNKLNTNLTSKQLYAANQILEDKRTRTKSYATGPYLKDVFALVPLKLSGMTFGQTYMEFGGTMQNQDRKYFGPVRIQKLSVKLMNDKGSVVSLNGANWSFCLICEILNQSTS